MKMRFVMVVGCLLGVVSCGVITKKPAAKVTTEANPFGPTGVPPALRGDAGGTAIASGGNAQAALAKATPDDELILTDPDNPDKVIPELDQLLTKKTSAPKTWEDSITKAKQRAIQEGKPLLIWFTDSKNNPICKTMTDEWMNSADWEKWASEKLVRLKVDANPLANEYVNGREVSLAEKEGRIITVRGYSAKLQKQYKVMGQPTLVLCNPSGEVIAKYTGYKSGQKNYYWGLVKQGEVASTHAYQTWRSQLEKKGYRMWSDKQGRKIFALLKSYSQGQLILVEPDGHRWRTDEKKLCEQDREWIEGQKKLRGL